MERILTVHPDVISVTDTSMVLRRTSSADAPILEDIADRHPELGDYHDWARSPESTELAVARACIEMALGRRLDYQVTRSGDKGHETCGGVALVNYGTSSEPGWHLGYWVVPDWRDQGVATQASRQLLTYATGALGIKRVNVEIADDNDPSQRVAEKLGAEATAETYGVFIPRTRRHVEMRKWVIEL